MCGNDKMKSVRLCPGSVLLMWGVPITIVCFAQEGWKVAVLPERQGNVFKPKTHELQQP